jgi:hypothetical protein
VGRYFLIAAMFLWSASTMAEAVVKSCDATFSAASNNHGSMIIENNGKITGKVRLDHDIDGGVFSLDDSLLVVYGLPKRVSRKYPQATRLSVYKVSPRPTLVMNEMYGGGVYDALFSDNQKFVVVENQYGVDVLDLIRRKSKSFDSTYAPYSTQKCHPK